MQEENRVVWITGASSGIGEALAYHLSGLGHRLILSARRADRLLSVKSRCPFPEKVAVLPIDLEQTESLQAATGEALALYGHIDVLVNNAGISQRSLIVETDLDVYDRLMRANYLGTVALTKALLPEFLKRGTGHFVVVTSLMGKFGSPLRSGYCGAKHALHGFFDVLRMEHEKDGVQVSLICPGFVQTAIAHNALTADGSPQRRPDEATEKGMDPARFAEKMWRAVQAGKWEVYIGGWETLGVGLKRFFPRLAHRVVLRSRVV